MPHKIGCLLRPQAPLLTKKSAKLLFNTVLEHSSKSDGKFHSYPYTLLHIVTVWCSGLSISYFVMMCGHLSWWCIPEDLNTCQACSYLSYEFLTFPRNFHVFSGSSWVLQYIMSVTEKRWEYLTVLWSMKASVGAQTDFFAPLFLWIIWCWMYWKVVSPGNKAFLIILLYVYA